MRAGASSCVEDHRINRLIADRGPATCGTNTIGYWQVPGLQEKSTMGSRLLTRSIVLLLTLWSVASFAAVTPYPPYPGAKPSPAFKVTVDGQPVFVHRFLTYDQFQFMDYASFSMTGKVHVTVTKLVGEMNVLTCDVRPLAYGIRPRISGNTVSFDLDRPRYLLVFPNEMAAF